jgi:hypothetical protein
LILFSNYRILRLTYANNSFSYQPGLACKALAVAMPLRKFHKLFSLSFSHREKGCKSIKPSGRLIEMENAIKNIQPLFITLLLIFSLAGCQKTKPLTDDTLVTSLVDGVTLTHRYAITPPQTFTPINEDYRALYAASLMSEPDFGGKIVRTLENGETYVALGQAEHFWIALADKGQQELIGYVPLRAVVKSSLYADTVRKDSRRVRKSSKNKKAVKNICVTLGDNSKACKKANENTWIID